jgi:hypothetical protein
VSASNDDLRRKIDEAKRRLALPQLLEKLGLSAHAKKRARCPFPGHDDKHPSFSVFQGEHGFWRWSCFAGCGNGDEIMFLVTLKGISMTQAIKLYLDMAGFPPCRSHKSREYPKSRESRAFPESLEFPVSPVSKGQALEETLKALGTRNACTEPNSARKRLWQLLRDLKAIEKAIGREVEIAEFMPAFNEWHRLSEPFLDPAKTRDDYLAEFVAGLRKVRVPTGEGDTLNRALAAVSTRTNSELPVIPGLPDAPESWRRLLALHWDLFSRSTRKNNTYFLSYRDAAKAHKGLSRQLAYDVTLAFDRLGFIKIVDKGKAGASGGKAAEFRYLLAQPGDEKPQRENRDSTESAPAEDPPF